MELHRPLFCPICGAELMVDVPSTELPEVHRLPEHYPATDVNLCQGLVITVTISFDKCGRCGCNMSKNSAGVCRKCYVIPRPARSASISEA